MDNRRFVTFLVFFFAFTWIYTNVILPKLFPPPVPPAVVEDENADAAEDEAVDESAVAPETAEAESSADGEDGKALTAEAKDDSPAVHPNKLATIGSLDASTGYFVYAELNSTGAAIESVQLSDPRFKELRDTEKQVQVVGTNSSEARTFTMAVDVIDEQLKKSKLSLETIDWELVSSDIDHATFAFESPDHSVRVEKTYRVTKIDVPPAQMKEAFLNRTDGFTIDVELTASNLTDEEQTLAYEVQGPVGVILENVEHTRKYLDIKLEFVDDDDAVTMGAKAVDGVYTDRASYLRDEGKRATSKVLKDAVKQADAWTEPFRYVGVDVQFFAALISQLDERPESERLTDNWIERVYPVMTQKVIDDINKSDISFRMSSAPIAVPPKESVTHKYGFFVGPKRSHLLDPPPLEARQVLDYGSWFGTIARGMHWLLDTLYGWGMPYFMAIISLTILVRGALFPLSRKQAISAARMKELQPKLAELKIKCGDDKQKFAQAQMELWRKNKINPLGGCFPLLFQFPIFISLYTCLNTAVDLRLSGFLWIENLAAPDALTTMPNLPFLGSDFNLLPCITVVLFMTQQKLFMPPPTDEQQAAQQKMMNYMTIFFGFMFWHVPAGLCIYFIASSVWGIAERTLLGKTAVAPDEPEATVIVKEPAAGAKKNIAAKEEPPAKPGFFGKLAAMAEEAKQQAEKTQAQQQKKNNKGGKGNKKKKKGR